MTQANSGRYSQQQDSPLQQVLFVLPVFNDWRSLTTLLEQLDQAIAPHAIQAGILAIDDASNLPAHGNLHCTNFQAIEYVNILKLKRNLGHQRAIAIGLAYAEAHYPTDMVVVMDSDGEDTPQDAVRLIYACEEMACQKIVFARRSKRSESWPFRFFYQVYRRAYRLLTGFDIQVGNFSIIPVQLLGQVVVVSEIWTHYAAGILKAKLPSIDIPTCRGYRYHGQSKMNFVSLVTHGLSAISVYGEVIGVRFLVASFGLIFLTILGLIAVLVIRFTTTWAIPGWTSYLVVTLIAVILLIFIIALSFIFLILNGRNNMNFLPVRDYHHFVLTLDEFFHQSRSYEKI